MSAMVGRLGGVVLAMFVATAGPALAQAPVASSPVNGTRGIDAEAPVTLAWTAVLNASSYTVEFSHDSLFTKLLPLKDAQVSPKADAQGLTYVVQFTDETTLHAGHTYYWRVRATVDGALLTGDIAAFTTAGKPFGGLERRHFSLTRAEDGIDKDKPATFGFIRQGGSTSSQQVVAEFLLGWKGPSRFIPRDGSFALSPSFGLAGNMASDKDSQDTMAKVAGGVVADWSFGAVRIWSLNQAVHLAYEGDQAFGGASLLFEYRATYSGRGVGRFYPIAPSAPAQILVRPSLLAAVAHQQDDAASTSGHAPTRIGPQLDVKVRLNLLARALGVSGILLSVTDRWYSLSGYSRDHANYFTGSLDVQLAKGFTFGYSYKQGQDAPTFKGVNRMALTVGIGF